MAWRRIGDKPLSELNADPIDWRIYATLGADELESLRFEQRADALVSTCRRRAQTKWPSQS